MIEQVSVAVQFTAFYIKSKAGAAGLTVTVDVYNYAGTKIVDNAAAIEIGGGFYKYVLAAGSTANEGMYFAVFKTTDDDVPVKHIPTAWAIGVAGIEALSRIGSAQVTVVNPVSQLGTTITLVSGDDYLNADGRALIFTRASGSTEWPDLTGATVRLKCDLFSSITGTVVVATGIGQQVRFDVPRTTTASLVGSCGFEIEATLATSSNVVTLIRGNLTILKDI